MLPIKADKFDERKIELNKIKTVFNEFIAKVSILEKISVNTEHKDTLLSDIKQRFDKLFDILYSTD